MKKKFLILLASLSVACTAAGAALANSNVSAKAATPVSVDLDFTDTMDSAAFKAPTSNYGWKVAKGALTPDNSMTPNNQIAYLDQAIALNENKYISLDFYVKTSAFDFVLVPDAETLNPWATGIGVHTNPSGWMTLNTNLDLGPGWLSDYTGAGSCVDGYAHKLEITSDGTNLTFKIDGVDAFAEKTVAIPANSVRVFVRADKDSYIDNLYIASSKPTATTAAVDVDFTDKTDLNDFTAMAPTNGWTGGNGKYHPVDAGALYNASATKYNQALDLTGKKYISFDFYSTAATFDVGLLDTAAGNMWGNGLFIHLPFSDGNTIGINSNIDCPAGTYYDGMSINCIDGKAHTLEIFVDSGKVSYALDGNALVGNGGTAQFNAPANQAYLVFRAVGTESYIDNLYIADSAPTDVALHFDAIKDETAFTAWNSAGWTTADGGFAAKTNWASTMLTKALDLTKNQEITFDVYLSSAEASDANRQFNVGFFAEEDLATASTSVNGKNYSFGATLFLSKNFGRQQWIADVGATLYNDTWHSVKITVQDKKMSIAVDGVAYDQLTTDIPADTAYMLLQTTSTATRLDNLQGFVYYEETPAITYTVTFKNWDGTVLQTGEVAENTLPVYAGETPTKAADENYTYTFTGWDKEIVAATGAVEYVAQFEATEIVVTYTVTFKNWDGEVLQTGEVEENTLPVYAGETPKRAADEDYTYTFKGWDKEIVVATGAVEYVAQYEATPILVTYTVTFKNYDGTVLQTGAVAENTLPEYTGEMPTKETDSEYIYIFDGWDKEIAAVTGEAEYTAKFKAVDKYIGKLDLDFSATEQADMFVAYGNSAGWSVADGVFKPNANWATVNSLQLLDLTKDQQITFDVYLSSKEASDINRQFNVGFFATTDAETNKQAGSGVNYSLGATMFYGSSFSRTAWVADELANLYNDSVHAVKIVVKGGKLSIKVDGVAYDKLTTDIPANSAYLLLQSTSTETYVDNLKVGEIVKEPYEDVFEKYGSSKGWRYEDGKLVPNAEWSTMNTIEQIDFTKAQEITFNVYLSSKDVNKQFNVGFFETKVEETNTQVGTGLTVSFGATVWVSTNFGRNGWASECVKNYFDDKLHSVSIKVIDKAIAVTVDDELLYFSTNGEPFTPTLTVNKAYLLMQATSTEAYITDYAVNEITMYTVTFKNADGSVLQTLTVEEGAMPAYTGETPEKAATAQYSYTFKGWDKEITVAAGDVEYTATYESTVNKYTATLVKDNGEANVEIEAEYGTSAAVIYAAEYIPVKAGHTFVGWYLGDYKVQETDALTENLTMTAKYTVNTYAVTWKNEDGSVLKTDEVAYGALPEYNGATPEKAATAQYTYTFKGWNKEVVAVTGEVTYTATFESTVNTYTVTWKNEDGSVLKTDEVAYGATPAYTGATPEKAADDDYTYTFSGWDKALSAVTGNVEYVAQFTAEEKPAKKSGCGSTASLAVLPLAFGAIALVMKKKKDDQE